MHQYTQEQLETQYQKLPKLLQEALFGPEVAYNIFDAGKKSGLTIEQIGILADETGYVLLGLTRPSEFINNLKESLGIDTDRAREIASEINHAVFFSLRIILKSTHHIDVNVEEFVKPSPLPTPTHPTPPTTTPLFRPAKEIPAREKLTQEPVIPQRPAPPPSAPMPLTPPSWTKPVLPSKPPALPASQPLPPQKETRPILKPPPLPSKEEMRHEELIQKEEPSEKQGLLKTIESPENPVRSQTTVSSAVPQAERTSNETKPPRFTLDLRKNNPPQKQEVIIATKKPDFPHVGSEEKEPKELLELSGGGEEKTEVSKPPENLPIHETEIYNKTETPGPLKPPPQIEEKVNHHIFPQSIEPRENDMKTPFIPVATSQGIQENVGIKPESETLDKTPVPSKSLPLTKEIVPPPVKTGYSTSDPYRESTD